MMDMVPTDAELKAALVEAYKKLLAKQTQTEAAFIIPPAERLKIYVRL